jgi:hypothetical protein
MSAPSRPSTQLRSLYDSPAERGPYLLDVFAPVGISLVLFAGYFKATPLMAGLPVDLTFLGIIVLLMAMFANLVHTKAHIPRTAFALPMLWCCFAVGLAAPGVTSYSETKVERLFTVTLVSALAPVLLLTTTRRQRIWCWSLISIGVLVTALAVLFPNSTVGASDRLAIDGSTTIAAGRAAGVAVVVICAAMLSRAAPLMATVPATVLLCWTMLYSGSRGPVLGAVIAVCFVAIMRPGSGADRIRRCLAAIAITAVVGAVLYELLGSSFAFNRVATFLTGAASMDGSIEARSLLYTETAKLIPHQPWGIGWGNALYHLPAGIVLSSGDIQYSHNVVLEITAEAGWLAGIAFVLFVALSLVRLVRTSGTPVGSMLLGVAVFFLVNALSSGDVNANRTMFASLAVAWAIRTDVPATTRGHGVSRSRRSYPMAAREQYR